MPPEIEAAIHSLSHDGRGVAAVDGKTIFVDGALPQEKIRCQVTRQHSRYNEGTVIEVMTPAVDRVTADCPHFAVCGGCSLQHLSMNGQLQFKQQVLLEQLKHFGKVVPEIVLPALTGAAWGYRRKARLGVRYVRKKGKLLVGFREKHSNYLADLQQCLVLHPSIGERIVELSQLIAGLTHYESIPQIEIAVGDTASALVFRHLTPLCEEDLARLGEFAQASGLHVYLQPGAPESIHRLWPLHTQPLAYTLPDQNIEILFGPLDFIQVNGEMNRLMLRQALMLLALQPDDQILDLFCGLGNFTLPIARYVRAVTGIEGSAVMVRKAEENACHNQIINTKFYRANLMEPVESAEWMRKQYDKILLDPPRSGAKEIIAHFSKFSAKKVVYISCNPATLARDAGELVHTHGYSLKQTGTMNMFPHTSHIEAIALFER